jgi:hypothetical protein
VILTALPALLGGLAPFVPAPARAQKVAPPAGKTPSGTIFDRLQPETMRPVFVPGHWERRLSEHEVHVPPLTGQAPDGRTITWPAGVQPLPAHRQAP